MKLVRGLGAVVAVALMSAPLAASAQVPAQMPIQGFLTDAGGTPVNGATSITFAIYDTDVATTPLFSETQTVMVDQGNFAAYLGDTTALDLMIFGNGSARFVGIQVGTDAEMTPRLALGTVPYAALAEYARGVRWADVSGIPAAISGFDPSLLQRRVTGTCAAGSSINAIAMDGTVTCEADDVGMGGGGGDITGVTPGSGLSGGGLSGDVALAVDRAVIQARVGGTCPVGQSIRAIAMDGSVMCEVDDLGPAYTPGTGLALVGTTFSIAAGGVTSLEIRDGTIAGPDHALNSIDAALQRYGMAQSLVFYPTAVAAGCPDAAALGGNNFGSTASATNVNIGTMFFNGSSGGPNLGHPYTRGRLVVQCHGDGVFEVRTGGCATVAGTITCSGGSRPWTAASAEFAIAAGGADYNLQVRATAGTVRWANPTLLVY